MFTHTAYLETSSLPFKPVCDNGLSVICWQKNSYTGSKHLFVSTYSETTDLENDLFFILILKNFDLLKKKKTSKINVHEPLRCY